MSGLYQRLTVEEFGRHLLETNDLDPVYVALVKSGWSRVRLNRWLLAYWCFYDCGVASYIAEGEGQANFWGRMFDAAQNVQPTPFDGRWRRASERRHFRGEQAETAVDLLCTQYHDAPEDMASYCAGTTEPETCSNIMSRVKEHRGFGDWIAFKVADMAETVMGNVVSFSEAEALMFEAPKRGAALVAEQWGDPNMSLSAVVEGLLAEFSDFRAPPCLHRPLGLQEIETILCKWKSHLSGHYPLNKDTVEIREHLLPWIPHSRTATEFYHCMPEVKR